MSQYDFGTIDPYVVDGVQLADMLNQWRDAVHSWHRGASRPAYVVPGMMWINDTGGAANWVVNVYLSPTIGDVAMFNYNTMTGAITLAAAAGGTFAAAVLLAQANANPQVQWNATGNPIDAKNWRQTVNRDGTTTNSVPTYPMRLYAETVLAAPANEMRVNVPAATKAIELWFMTSNTASAIDSLLLSGLNGAAIINTNNHQGQSLTASGATVSGAFQGASTAWGLGSISSMAGVLRPQPISGQTFVTGQVWATAGATRYSTTYAWEGGPNGPTGFRIANNTATTFIAGSYLRAFAAY
jgi:hypothetical protein